MMVFAVRIEHPLDVAVQRPHDADARQHRVAAPLDAVVGFLCEFDGRNGPFPIVASDRDPQAVQVVQPNAVHRTGLSIGEDHGLADKLSLGLLELAEDRRRTDLRSWHFGRGTLGAVPGAAGSILV
jgi:hypothetical protein